MALRANNFSYTDGIGLQYWRSLAQGMPVSNVSTGQLGATIEHIEDQYGHVVRNGGMKVPKLGKIAPGIYYRFISTIKENTHQQEKNAVAEGSQFAGWWWIDGSNMHRINDYARLRDISLAQAAREALIIPSEWGDCGYVGTANLTTHMKAFKGKGNTATSSISPDSIDAAKSGLRIHAGVQHLNIDQLFIPGTPELLARVFNVVKKQHVLHKGTVLLGLPQV